MVFYNIFRSTDNTSISSIIDIVPNTFLILLPEPYRICNPKNKHTYWQLLLTTSDITLIIATIVLLNSAISYTGHTTLYYIVLILVKIKKIQTCRSASSLFSEPESLMKSWRAEAIFLCSVEVRRCIIPWNSSSTRFWTAYKTLIYYCAKMCKPIQKEDNISNHKGITKQKKFTQTRSH